MTAETKLEAGILAALLALWGWVYFSRPLGSPAVNSGSPGTPGKTTAALTPAIPDAVLRLDRLRPPAEKPGADLKRNIFEYGGRVRAAQAAPAALAPSQPPPPAPKPPAAPVRFYGFAQPARGGARRVFLTDGDEIYTVAEGETIARRFRLVRVGAENVEIEDLTGSHRWVVPLEQP